MRNDVRYVIWTSLLHPSRKKNRQREPTNAGAYRLNREASTKQRGYRREGTVKSANAAVKDLVQIQSQITTIPVQETADVGTTTASPSVPTITLQNAQLRASSY